MSFPIALLTDDFAAVTPAAAWTAAIGGSATMSQGGGQLNINLPSSTAGTHSGTYTSNATYDLTSGSFYWNIGTMVSTAVAAGAYFQLYSDSSNQLYWRQLSNAITARTLIGGVDTQRYTATWSAATYKYLRIRESGGTVFWDSSTNGTTWTNRFSMASPIAITGLYVQFAANCGNVASPGSLRIDGVNLILPAPSSTWRETTADWGIGNRLRSVTLASDGGKQGVLVTADTMTESTRSLGGTLRYFAGPLGSSSGGYLQCTEYASLALAQASAFPIPIDGRVDLSAQVDARYMRLYHRSIDASSHTIYEYMPRRLVQADDIEAESIRAINISAGAITADKIFVLDLSAITATIGQLTIASSQGLDAWLYQGTGTGTTPTTGLKIFNSGGIGKLSTYNATVEQVTLDTDGVLKAGAGAVYMDVNGLSINNATGAFGNVESIKLQASGVNYAYITAYDDGSNASLSVSHGGIASRNNNLNLTSTPSSSAGHATAGIYAQFSSTQAYVYADYNNAVTSILCHATSTKVDGALNVGTATGTTVGTLSTSGSVGLGMAAVANGRLYIKAQDATSSNYALVVQDSAAANLFYVRDDGYVSVNKSGGSLGFFGAGAISKPTVTGAKASNAALGSLLTALANLGLLTDSSSA